MKTYDLYLETGPQRRTTVAHVPELLGCTFNGPTTDATVESAPNGIRAYLRFLARHGERFDHKMSFGTAIAELRADGGFLGTAFLPTDTKALTRAEGDALMQRLAGLHSDVRTLTQRLTPKQLEAKPARGRPIRAILSHVCVEGAYLRGVTGASRIQREVDQGKRHAHEALEELHRLEAARLAAMSPVERRDVIMRGQSPWSARAALRRMLEHCWEHYVEIATRLGVEP
jgi:predicted RNase H-like HicB family nuclease